MNATTTTATRTAVSATGLRKAYGDTVVLDGVDLVEAARRMPATYSGGRRRRLDIATSWPTTGSPTSSTRSPIRSSRASISTTTRHSTGRPDDPRLVDLADRTARWLAHRPERPEDAEWLARDPVLARLVTTAATPWSAAWNRLAEIARERATGS